MNSRSHSRLRRIQMDRKVASIYRRLVDFIYEENRPMLEAAIEDKMLYGVMGRWSVSDDHVLTYDRIYMAQYVSTADSASVEAKA
jgi:hypothetical protein